MALNGLSDLDHVALSRLVVECVWRSDHSPSTVHELFAEDGEIRFGGKVFAKGRGAVVEWGRNRREPDTIRHVATNLRFEADGPDRANGTGIEIVFYAPESRLGPEATLPLMVGDWTFAAVRAEDGWRLAVVDFRVLFDRRESPPDPF